MEEAKLAMDLVGLEYPADIKATYDDLPTDYDKLFVLREHLYYLFTIGTETNNDDLADYALFANLHVRYRILQFQKTLTPADEYYRRIYEQKLPLMKWHPLTLHHHETKTIEDECACEFSTPDVNEVFVSSVQEPEHLVSHSYEQDVPTYVAVTQDMPEVDVPVVPFHLVVAETPKVDEDTEKPNETKSPARGLDIRSVTFGKRCIILRTVERSGIFTTRFDTSNHVDVIGVSGYGVWFYDTVELYARLFRHMTGRFSSYEDANVFLSVTSKQRNCLPLTTLALKYLSKTWFTSPPSR